MLQQPCDAAVVAVVLHTASAREGGDQAGLWCWQCATWFGVWAYVCEECCVMALHTRYKKQPGLWRCTRIVVWAVRKVAVDQSVLACCCGINCLQQLSDVAMGVRE